MTRIGIVTSSTRPTRIGHHVAQWVASQAPDGVEVEPIDLRDLALPLLDEPEMPSSGQYAHEQPSAGLPSSTVSTPSCSSCPSTTGATTQR
jgi:NAD(P)H-dependent FMN reductase